MLNWKNLQTVLIDMDGTLLDKRFDNYFWDEHLPKRYAEIKNVDKKHFERILQMHIKNFYGTLNWSCVDFWSKLLDVDILSLEKEITHLIDFQPYAINFLDALRLKQYRTVLVTNSPPKILELKILATGLDKYVDRLISAHDLGLPKENDAFWHRLNQVEFFQPTKTVIIDDDLAVLRNAKMYNIAYQVAIKKPDSRSPSQDSFEFYGIDSFAELLPFITTLQE